MFRKCLVHNDALSNERNSRKDDEDGSSRKNNNERTNRRKTKQKGRQHANGNNQQPPHRNSRYHSTRLISESAARRTTQLFLDAYNNSSYANGGGDEADIWEDAATLLAAEQALEFWANRNNQSRKNKKHYQQHQSRGKQQFSKQNESTLEADAGMALSLFTALHHFHCKYDRVLTNGMYSHVVDALAKGNLDQISKADALLRQFISLYILHHANASEENNYPLVVEELDPSQNKSSAPIISLAPPNRIEWNENDTHHFPNQIRITGVLRGYAWQSDPEGAESLLRLMVALSLSGSLSGGNNTRRMFCPNEVGFATVIDAYSRVADGSNATRVLEMMKKRSFSTGACLDDTMTKGRPVVNGANVVAYNAAISAWARCAKATPQSKMSQTSISSSRAAAENAESLLREMWSEHETWSKTKNYHKHPKTIVLPDVVTYSTVISAYATCLDQPYGMKRAKEVLVELEGLAAQEYNESQSTKNVEQSTNTFIGKGGSRNSHGFQPNTTVYNTVLQAYANSGDALSAEAILRSMISLHSSTLEGGGGGPYKHVHPNTRTFNVVLNAWSKRGGRDCGTKAKEILDRFEKMSSDGDGKSRPDVISYNTVLAAWSKSASVGASTYLEREEGQETSCVVGKSAAYEALKLLDRIEQQCLRDHNGVVKPDVISYNTTISAFANAAQNCENGVAMAEEAEALLFRMKGRMGIEPDSYSYNGVILAWARSSGGLPAVKRAESILRSMKYPTIVSWSTVVNAYAHLDSALKAEALLKEMDHNTRSFERSNNSHARIIPSVVLYNNVLHAWGRSSDGDASKNAEALLHRMENTTSKLPKPDIISYQLVLTALQHSKDPDKAERAKSVLDRFLASTHGQNFGATYNDIRNSYNCVLTASTYTSADAGIQQRKQAARILVETLRDMNHFTLSNSGNANNVVGPNQESYALFMQGCAHLLDPDSKDRNMLLKSAFHECCKKGLLNRTIWNKFCNALRPELAEIFIGELASRNGIGLEYEGLPKEWSSSGPKS